MKICTVAHRGCNVPSSDDPLLVGGTRNIGAHLELGSVVEVEIGK